MTETSEREQLAAVANLPHTIIAARIAQGLARDQIDPLQTYLTSEECLAYGDAICRAALRDLQAENDRLTRERDALREALTALVDEAVDYATINHLGDPEKKHNIRQARAALSAPEPSTEGEA